MKPVSLCKGGKREGQRGRRRVTLKRGFLTTEMCLPNVVRHDRRAWYVQCSSLSAENWIFFFLFIYFFYNISMTSFPFPSHKLLKPSTETVREYSIEWLPWGPWAMLYLTKLICFPEECSAETGHLIVSAPRGQHPESLMPLCWPYDWFITLSCMGLSRQICWVVSTRKNTLLLLRVGCVNVHGVRL